MLLFVCLGCSVWHFTTQYYQHCVTAGRSFSVGGNLFMTFLISGIELKGRIKNRWVTIYYFNKTNLIKGKALEHKLVHWIQFQIQCSIIILDLRSLNIVVSGKCEPALLLNIKIKSIPHLCIVQQHGNMKLANINCQHWHYQCSTLLTNHW